MTIRKIDTGEGVITQLCTLSVAANAPIAVPAGEECPQHHTKACLDTFTSARYLAESTRWDLIRKRKTWRERKAAWEAAGGMSA
jgi:hypothetical protein